jgi:hypothetical protein
VTVDMPRIGRDINFIAACPLTLAVDGIVSYGSVDFTNAGALTGAFAWTMDSQRRGGTTHTLTLAGISFPSTFTSQGYNATLQMADSGTLTTGNYLFNHTSGTFDANDFNITFGQLQSTGGTTRTIYMGSGTWTTTRAINDQMWDIRTVTGLTFYCETSTILVTGVTTGNIFYTGGLTYNNITLNCGTSNFQFSSGCTINTLSFMRNTTRCSFSSSTFSFKKILISKPSNRTIILACITRGSKTYFKSPVNQSLKMFQLRDLYVTGLGRWEAFATDGNINLGGNYGFEWFPRNWSRFPSAAGWTHKIYGIANASILKVMGV